MNDMQRMATAARSVGVSTEQASKAVREMLRAAAPIWDREVKARLEANGEALRALPPWHPRRVGLMRERKRLFSYLAEKDV